MGRFPRERASPEPGFKGPMGFIKQTEWELRAVSRQREQHVQRPSKKTVNKVEYSANFKSSSHYGYKPRCTNSEVIFLEVELISDSEPHSSRLQKMSSPSFLVFLGL